MDVLFKVFFKVSPAQLRSGELSFSPVFNGFWLVLLLGTFAVLTWAAYRRTVFSRRVLDAAALPLLLRLILLLLLTLLLFRPQLVLSRIVPQTGVLAVLVDDSASMGLPADNPRGAPLQELLADGGGFMKRLGEDFQLRRFVFSSGLESNPGIPSSFSGSQTDLGTTLSELVKRTEPLPLAAVLLFTDGANNGAPLGSAVEAFRRRGVPVYTIGCGPEQLSRDLQLDDVYLPRSVLEGSKITARVVLRQTGFGGRSVTVSVRDGATLLQAVEHRLDVSSERNQIELSFALNTSGVRSLEFTVEPLEGESIPQNNRVVLPVEVRHRPVRVLLVEGRPRWEFKFLRRAVGEDPLLQVESLLRTALNKYYRQGVEGEDSLAQGFPTRVEDLFQYEGLILGDVEAGFFTFGQLEAVREFVLRRGAGLLVLGGSTPAAEGWGGTPVEEALPVWWQGSDREAVNRPVSVDLTSLGVRQPALSFDPDPERNRNLWRELPQLIDHQPVGSLKPGAVVLLEILGENDSRHPLLVYQRFGEGLSFAWLTGSSWRWQMGLEHTDQRHETFWRQLLRWLVETAEPPVSIMAPEAIPVPGREMQATVFVRDRAYLPIDSAEVRLRVIGPEGLEEEISAEWDPQASGLYRAAFAPRREGLYRLETSIELHDGGGPDLESRPTYFLVGSREIEYFNPVQDRSLLENLAAMTGGRYYRLDDVERLPDEIVYRSQGITRTQVLELFNMPVLLLLVLSLLIGEWWLRRRRGWI